MEILVRRSDLAKELNLVQGIVERKNSIPILSNVLAEARGGELRISATDLDVSLLCGCAAQVIEEGGVTLSAKKLYEIVRSLPESDVSLRLEKDAWTRIQCDRSEFRVAGLPREDFPNLPDGRSARTIKLPVLALKRVIQRTQFAITAEDARYYLAGALLLLENDSVAMVATDGHRLAWVRQPADLDVSEPLRVLVPRKAITELGSPDGRARARRAGRLPAGRDAPRLHCRWPHARLEDGRGAVPGLREGHRDHWRQARRGRPARRCWPRSAASACSPRSAAAPYASPSSRRRSR